MNAKVVLSIFPGADLLGMAFERVGFVVVKGPEKMMGGDVRTWHGVPGVFTGIIGGPPCKSFSRAVKGHEPSEGDLIPEFERVVEECQPLWFVMENVPGAYAPVVEGYTVVRKNLDAWWYGSPQHRKRSFWFGARVDMHFKVETPLPESERYPDPFPTVTATEQKYGGEQEHY